MRGTAIKPLEWGKFEKHIAVPRQQYTVGCEHDR